MYYIYNMRKTILIFIACIFRACLSVMAQTLPDTTIAPAKPQGHVTIPAPSWGYSLSLGGIMNPYMYISGLGKYFNIATTKWVKSKYPTKSYVDSVDSKRAISGYNPSGTIDANSVNLSGGYILDSVSTNIRNAPFPSISVSFIAAGNGVSSGSGLGRGAQLAIDNFSGAAALRGLGIAGYTPWYNIWTTKKLPLGTVGQSIRVNSDETGFESYTPSAGNVGTVTSITRGIGLVGNGTSITSTGSIVVDTTVIGTKSFENSLAPKNSPGFTGIPTAPTAATGTNTTQIATTSGVRNEINSLVNKNLAGGYGINALFYSPISQAASISVDTTQVKSKAGALIDYNNLSTLKANLNSPNFTGTPTTPNPTASNSVANKNYVDIAVAANTPSLPEVGVVIAPAFTGAITPTWSNIGTSTFTFNAGSLLISGGTSATLNNYLRYDAYGISNMESWTANMNITAGVVNSTSFGTGLAVQSAGSFAGNLNSIQIGLNMSSASTGVISLYYNNAITAIATSTNGMAISSGDNIRLLVKFIKSKVIATAYNLTTSQSTTLSFDIPSSFPHVGLITIPNAFRFGILSTGGSTTVNSFSVSDNDSKGADYVFAGTSITKGLHVDNLKNRYSELINNIANVVTVTNAGSSNYIEDINSTEVLSMQPKNIVLDLGINNISGGQPIATIQSRYSTLVNSFVSSGYVLGTNLFIMSVTPSSIISNSSLIPTFNAWLLSNYPSAYIETYNTLSNGTSLRYSIDGLHPSEEGHRILADLLINKFNLPSKSKKIGQDYQVMYNANSNVMVGDQNYKSLTPNYLLDIRTSTNGTQFHIGNSNTDNGGLYAGSSFFNAAYFLAGANYNGTNFVAKSTTLGGLVSSAGSMSFYGETGKTIGSAFTPILRGGYTAAGLWGFGSQTPTAFADFQAGTASIAALKVRMGTVYAGTEEGSFSFLSGANPYYRTAAGTEQLAYLSQVSAARTPFLVSANATMVLNADYLNTTATQYTLTLPSTTGFATDGSKIITVLATGTGGVKISVPSGYAMTSPGGAATTTGTGGTTITQNQKIQLIPIGTNAYQLQPLNGTVTVF